MMDGLTKFEDDLGKPRTKWSKAQWRIVAHELAGVKPTKGRPPLSDDEKKNKEFHIQAAEFWRDQNIGMDSKFDGDVGTVQKRLRPLTQKESTKAVLRDSLTHNKETLRPDKLDKKTDALVRKIQVMQKNKREK
jgi:hypothetical protein